MHMNSGNWRRHVASSLVIIAMVGLAFGSSKPDKDSSSTSPPPPEKPSTPDVSGDRTITGENFVGCTSKDDNDKLTEYAVQKDYEAFNRYLALRCLLYTSDAADEEDSVDLGGRRI